MYHIFNCSCAILMGAFAAGIDTNSVYYHGVPEATLHPGTRCTLSSLTSGTGTRSSVGLHPQAAGVG